jgi:8-oxo-dGTP diphosphatase
MTQVVFLNTDYQPSRGLTYSVIAARHNGLWIFVRHHDRSTWEIPGGHIEENETPYETAQRELREETGAMEYKIECVATYSVDKNGHTGFGRLYFAEVSRMGDLPEGSEIASVKLLESLPGKLTYPDIQPVLFTRILEYLESSGRR